MRSRLYGSSPCVRGTRRQGRHTLIAYRFIPVCTGNTARSYLGGTPQTVHPRVYGEHLLQRHFVWPLFGSSPCVRGTHFDHQTDAFYTRFIPVCTGNTNASLVLPIIISVHPRVYGEHNRRNRMTTGESGSSPCVRGTLPRYRHNPRNHRFIPVCTGNTTK